MSALEALVDEFLEARTACETSTMGIAKRDDIERHDKALTALREARQPKVREKQTVWECQIGEMGVPPILPPGADLPMRLAIEAAYREVVGHDAQFTFSGWGSELSEIRLAVVEESGPHDTPEPEPKVPEVWWCHDCGSPFAALRDYDPVCRQRGHRTTKLIPESEIAAIHQAWRVDAEAAEKDADSLWAELQAERECGDRLINELRVRSFETGDEALCKILREYDMDRHRAARGWA